MVRKTKIRMKIHHASCVRPYFKNYLRMKNLKLFFVLVLFLPLITNCKDSADGYKPNITGAMGEMLLVMDDKYKTTDGGEKLLEMLTQPMQGLPQVESIFNISVVPHRAFTDHMKIFRNLIITTISPDVKTEGVKYYTKNAWASEQALMRIEAKSVESLKEIVENEEIRIIGFFIKAERDRSTKYYTKYSHADLSKMVTDNWNLNMVIPNSFKLNQSNENFTWLSNETPLTSQGVFIYSFDYVGEGTFSKEYLLNKRDSVLRINVPGSASGSYMSTEHELPISFKELKVHGHNAVELRGLWKVVGDIMGGPFVLFAHHDVANNRVVVTDGYVYSPEKPNKRNFIWQTEAILYSLKFPTNKVEEENNK